MAITEASKSNPDNNNVVDEDDEEAGDNETS